MSQWKPGEVAMLTTCCGPPYPAVKDEKGWLSLDPRIGWVSDQDVISTRPLALIDPEDDDQVQRLYALYAGAPTGISLRGRDFLRHALREYAAPAPPKPEEPTGLGAVVKDRDGNAWVRTHATGYPWHSALNPSDLNATAARKWADIDAVEVFTEGVTP